VTPCAPPLAAADHGPTCCAADADSADPLQLRTGMAILSYTDNLVFGITADYDAAQDVDELATGIDRAVVRLVDVSGAPWRATPMGTLALVPG
jgi:diacylglycerol O-acyltransferase / wax synthase